MKAYSEDLRLKGVEQRAMGKREAARSFGPSLSSVKRCVAKAPQSGTGWASIAAPPVGATRDLIVAERGPCAVLSTVSGLVPELLALSEERGCKLIYVPPYPRDFNPIEVAFSKIRDSLQKAEVRNRKA